VHGSPRKVNEYLFDDKPDRLYERLAADGGDSDAERLAWRVVGLDRDGRGRHRRACPRG
jgi:hypothetical protein